LPSSRCSALRASVAAELLRCISGAGGDINFFAAAAAADAFFLLRDRNLLRRRVGAAGIGGGDGDSDGFSSSGKLGS